MARELPFLLVTAHARTSVVVEAMRRGAVSVLDKPWNDDELWQAIRQAIAIDGKKRESHLHTAATRQKLATLTQKEQEVLELVLAGKPNKLMADRLGVSLRTIENRRRSVFQKIGRRHRGRAGHRRAEQPRKTRRRRTGPTSSAATAMATGTGMATATVATRPTPARHRPVSC